MQSVGCSGTFERSLLYEDGDSRCCDYRTSTANEELVSELRIRAHAARKELDKLVTSG